jgi:phage terminase small subunit
MPKTDGLSDQHKKFARLIVIDGLNQGDAYVAAGYKAKDAGVAGAGATRLLKNVKLQEYMDTLRAEIRKEAVLDAAHFAKRLERIAAAAEKTLFYTPSESDSGDVPTDVLSMTPKEAAETARSCSMDAARLLGELVQKTETTIITHEDRLAAIREKLNGSGRNATTH